MSDGLMGSAFEKKVLRKIEADLSCILGNERGQQCAGAFATAVLKAQEYGDMPNDLLERFFEHGFSCDESALAFFDASITTLKELLVGVETTPDVDSIIADMETAVDRMFLDNPGRIIPRNGSAGPGMNGFAADVKI